MEAANAFEALHKTKHLSPSLAVVDFSILKMNNGSQLVRQLKAREPTLPIFILTADNDVDIEKEALAFGITAVFSKLDDLTSLIANARVVCGLE
jgi:DNA-binding NarL/FixJ family response regulator